jgi:hypothetical protein
MRFLDEWADKKIDDWEHRRRTELIADGKSVAEVEATIETEIEEVCRREYAALYGACHAASDGG